MKFQNCIVFIFFLFLTACSLNDGINTPEEIAEFINVDPNNITQMIENNDSILVFYEPSEENFDVGFGWIKRINGVWKWVHGNQLQNVSNEELTYSWSNLDNMYKEGDGTHIFLGIINNDSIDKVHISYRNQWELNEFAQFIEVNNRRVWFVLSDYYYGTIPGVNIIGYNSSEEKIYEHY